MATTNSNASYVSASETMKLIYPKTYMARPHVTTEYDDSALTNSASDSQKNIFLLGSATQGDPNKVYEVKSSVQARAIFGSGDLVTAMELIWNPNNDNYQNGGTVYAQRVENAKVASTKSANITFTSTIFGKIANSISVKLAKNPLTTAYDLTVQFDDNNYTNHYLSIGNVFSISYKGSAKTSAYKVTGNSATPSVATKFSLYTGDTISDSTPELISFDLTKSQYDTLEKLMNAISKVPGFKVTPLKSCAYIKSSSLDFTKSTVTIGSDDNPTIVHDFYGDLLYATRYEPYVKIDLDNSVISGQEVSQSIGTGTVTEIPVTFLAGGDDGTVPVSWADKFKNVHGHNIYYIIPLTDQENIHAELKEFLDEQNTLGYNYMAFVGGGFNESVNQLLNRQMQLRSDRIALIANSGYYTSLYGSTVHIPAYLMASYVAGDASSLPVGNAVTNKYINLSALDNEFSGDELDQLNENGIVAIENVVNRNGSGGYKIIEDVTTFNSTNEPVKSYLSLRELTDYLFDSVRIELDKNFIGQPVNLVTGQLVATFIEGFLKKKVAEGMLASYNRDSITAIVNDNAIYVAFSCAPVREARTILVKGTYTNVLTNTELQSGSETSNNA